MATIIAVGQLTITKNFFVNADIMYWVHELDSLKCHVNLILLLITEVLSTLVEPMWFLNENM